jgi:hypothetical protein
LWVPHMTIVQGAFSQLLAPGLKTLWTSQYLGSFPTLDDLEKRIEREEQMAILHPDTSKIPIWRRRPERMEHPITAWRAWGLVKEKDGWYLSSVSADCTWEGPVLRAHKRPVDPKYWDQLKEIKQNDPETYYAEMHDTFELAGIYAVKTKEQAESTAITYSVSCYGEVHLWGRVAQFRLGYRAEVCMIRRLLRSSSLYNMLNAEVGAKRPSVAKEINAILADLSRHYDCEVTLV